MTWTKLGDEFADECWTLSSDAFRLHTEGLVWSNRKATDGQLAKDDMRRWAKRPDAAEELVSIGWWEDHGEHYQIVHHLGYQRTKEEIAHQSNVNAENAKKRWAAKKAAAAKKAEAAAAAAAAENEPQCESHNEPQCERARTEQNRLLREGGTKFSEAENGETNHAEPFTPTAEQLARIDANVRRGYET